MINSALRRIRRLGSHIPRAGVVTDQNRRSRYRTPIDYLDLAYPFCPSSAFGHHHKCSKQAKVLEKICTDGMIPLWAEKIKGPDLCRGQRSLCPDQGHRSHFCRIHSFGQEQLISSGRNWTEFSWRLPKEYVFLSKAVSSCLLQGTLPTRSF